MKRRLTLFAALLLIAVSARADTVTFSTTATTGTAVITLDYTRNWTNGSPSNTMTVSVAWTSSADGNVTIVLPPLSGIIAKVVTDPGSTAPSDNWDMVLTDVDGFDAFGGSGANRDTANSEAFKPFVSTTGDAVIYGTSTLAITNAGDSKTGTVKLYIRK